MLHTKSLQNQLLYLLPASISDLNDQICGPLNSKSMESVIRKISLATIDYLLL